MGIAGFTLADRLGAKTSPCSVPGCTRTWISIAGGKAAKLGGRGAADPSDPTSSMCDPCRDAYRKASDSQRPCDRPGCDGTWTWSVMQQVEAQAAHRQAPAGLCASCDGKLAALEDRSAPCAVPGCARSAVFTRKAQLLAGAPDVELEMPALRCAQCEGVYRKLKDRPVRCGINGCNNKWSWGVDEQIAVYAAGLPNEPPLRMCDSCKEAFGAIADREVRCRTSGCKKTWTWSRSDQLNACLAGKPVPKAPHRMCESCIGIYQSLKDVERPCRRAGCKGTWLDKRGGQLARAVRGKTGDPYPQYCESCAKEIGDLEDRQIPCKTENCTGTWTWTKQAQLAAGVRPEPKEQPAAQDAAPEAEAAAAAEQAPAAVEGAPAAENGVAAQASEQKSEVAAAPAAGRQGRNRKKKRRREIRPPEKKCPACLEFLKDKKTLEIACKGCATPIFWPPESQLQTHLGAWTEPSLCGACKRDLTEAARAAQREALRHPSPAAPTDASLPPPVAAESAAEPTPPPTDGAA